MNSSAKPIRCGPYRGKFPADLLRQCILCGRGITKPPWGTWRGYLKRVYCSLRCRDKYLVGQNNGQWKSRGETRCTVCGGSMLYSVDVPPSSRKRKFCSPACRRRYLHHGTDVGSDYVVAFIDRDGNPIREHVLVAERAMGRSLRRGEVVHHINLNRRDNRNCNLLVCSASYHQWLHQEMVRRYAREHFANL